MTALKKVAGPWGESELTKFLHDAEIPIRLAAISSDGHPIIASLWFLYEDGKIYCACRNNAAMVSLIEKNNVVGFEVAGEKPPYFGIRGIGSAILKENIGEKILRKLIDRYLGDNESGFRNWLLSGVENEIAIEISPSQITSWDYQKRMSQ